MLYFFLNSRDVDFGFFLVGINITRNVEVAIILANIIRSGDKGIFVFGYTRSEFSIDKLLIGRYDMLNIFFAEFVLILAVFILSAGIDEQNVF